MPADDEYNTKVPNVGAVLGLIALYGTATLSGTSAARQAVVLTTLTRVTLWQETDGQRRLLTFTPGDTVWHTAAGASADATTPPVVDAGDYT